MTPEQQAKYNATGLCPKCSAATMYYCSAATPGECPLQGDDDEAPEAAPPVDPVIEKIKSIRRDVDSACDVFRNRPSDQDLGQAIRDLCGVVEAIYAGINAVLDDQSAKASDPDPIIAAEHVIVERDGEWFVTPPPSLWGYDTADDMRAAEGFGPAEQTMTDFFYSTTGETARNIVVAIIEQGRLK